MPEIKEKLRKQAHSAYWYAKKYGQALAKRLERGWTYGVGGYIGPVNEDLERIYRMNAPWALGDAARPCPTTRMGRYLVQTSRPVHGVYGALFYPERRFDPMVFAFHAALDLGDLMREGMKRLTDPIERERLKEMVQQNLRKIQRPLYYARERERRRELRRARRKIRRRTTTAPIPTPEVIVDAWCHRRESKAHMIRLGGLLHDLECYVDNSLVFGGDGRIVRRRGGIRGWLKEHLPELVPHYKALMSYKAMAIKLRQATATTDPRPTAELLEVPHGEVVEQIFAQPGETRISIIRVLDDYLSPGRIFLEGRRSRRRVPKTGRRNVSDG